MDNILRFENKFVSLPQNKHTTNNYGATNKKELLSRMAEFPDKKIVWRIYLDTGYPFDFLTDEEVLRLTYGLNDENSKVLQYCTDVVYLDIGHNRYITNVDFIRYLPKLQVVILSITKISDISALAHCPDLEYVELLNTYIEDISPLEGLEKIVYLNIGDMPFLKDISPVFGMKSLKMVRVCMRTFNHVSREQVEELKEALPDCFVSDYGGDPTTSGFWRFADKKHTYTERYALLREQMLYDIPRWEDRQQNSPTRLEGDRER